MDNGRDPVFQAEIDHRHDHVERECVRVAAGEYGWFEHLEKDGVMTSRKIARVTPQVLLVRHGLLVRKHCRSGVYAILFRNSGFVCELLYANIVKVLLNIYFYF